MGSVPQRLPMNGRKIGSTNSITACRACGLVSPISSDAGHAVGRAVGSDLRLDAYGSSAPWESVTGPQRQQVAGMSVAICRRVISGGMMRALVAG